MMMKTGNPWRKMLRALDDLAYESDDNIQTMQIQLSAIESQVGHIRKQLDDVTRIQEDIKARISTLKDDVKDAAGGETRTDDDF